MCLLTYNLDPSLKAPLYEQLYRALRKDIMCGTLKGGGKLPSKRRLASHLRVSQITVETAYSQLLAEGYIYSEPRKGYFVQHRLLSPHMPEVFEAMVVEDCEKLPDDEVFRFDFRTNIVDTGCFPFSTWARLSRSVLSEYSDRLLSAAEPTGISGLREQIRRYLYDFRGLNVASGNILVGAGSEYLIGLMIQLLGNGRVYALENPGYRKLHQIFTRGGAAVRNLPLDDMGLRSDALYESDADTVYITPSHHFPLGTVMPAGRRLEVLRWASAKDGRYIIEDDYDSEFRYSSRPIPTLKELDREGRVIYVNTFAKSLAPSLRIGYLVLPDSLMRCYREKFSLYSSTVPSFEQYTLSEFMRTGAFERHISRSRKVYQSRRDALLSALRDEFTYIPYQVSGGEAGLHLILNVRNGMDEQTLIKTAAEQGVKAYGLSGYYAAPAVPPESTLVLGYAGMAEDDILEAVKLLRKAWDVTL